MIAAPKPTASEEPKESKRTMLGWCARSARFTSGDHMTPEEMMEMRLSSRYSPRRSSRARSIGLAKASPTMATLLTAWWPTACHSSCGSKLTPPSVTIEPPAVSVMKAVKRPVPCMRGQAGRWRSPGPRARTRAASSSSDATGGSPSTGFPPPPIARQRSSDRHMTPFGMPVVPPV